jgi:spoIIIJ-associated protein
VRPAEGEGWDSPDEDSELAALEGTGRLVRLAGLALAPRVTRLEDRLEIELTGADVGVVRERGLALLEDLEQLLPRAIHGLSGRMVRCRIDCAGLRGEREEALRALARAEAERVLATAEERLLDPLPPAERRIVHLELAERAGLRTDSLGTGYRKRVRIRPT